MDMKEQEWLNTYLTPNISALPSSIIFCFNG